MVLLIVLCVRVYMGGGGDRESGEEKRERERDEARLEHVHCVLTSMNFIVKASVVIQNHCGTRLHCTRLPSSHRLRAFPPTRE